LGDNLESKMQDRAAPGLGHGAYSYSEAAMIVGASRERIRRWADGYTYPRKHDVGVSAPVLQTDRDARGVLSFHELIELFLVRKYNDFGVPLDHIRRTAAALSEDLGPYPFASAKLKTDGKILLRETEAGLIQPAVRQLVADYAKDFLKLVDFERDVAVRFHPEAGGGLIVIDSERSYGQPIVEKEGVPTSTIYRLFLKEQDFDRVAEWFQVSVESAKAAVIYEAECRNVA